ncbi:GDSL-type esterase/lipase family protein [Streptomyces sp. NPDC048481]|uniref:GDSL-type esterase/lipase family protein n=1 Tax=Streptomyces sp. NPDC048481 TaxID=3365557 RepID=UPI00371D4E8F
MPLGDSITGSPDSRRAELWNRLRSAGRTSIDFVGTLSPQGCPQAFDGDNEGHGGELVTNVAHQNLLPAHLSATRSDIVVTHLGTNDLWSNIAPDRILTADRRPVTRMRASYPAMRILVAKILPMNPTNCPDRARRAVDLDGRIRGWARAFSTRGSPVRVGDQWTGFFPPTTRHLRRSTPVHLRQHEDRRTLAPAPGRPPVRRTPLPASAFTHAHFETETPIEGAAQAAAPRFVPATEADRGSSTAVMCSTRSR